MGLGVSFFLCFVQYFGVVIFNGMVFCVMYIFWYFREVCICIILFGDNGKQCFIKYVCVYCLMVNMCVIEYEGSFNVVVVFNVGDCFIK